MRKGAPTRVDDSHAPEEDSPVDSARHVRRFLAAILTGAVGWTAIDACKLLSASAWMIGAAVITAMVALITAAILGRDSRSPFERIMLFFCLMLQRPPATYLPPRPQENSKAARAHHQVERERIPAEARAIAKRPPRPHRQAAAISPQGAVCSASLPNPATGAGADPARPTTSKWP